MKILKIILTLAVGSILGALVSSWGIYSIQPKNSLGRSDMSMFIGSRLSDSSLQTFLDNRHMHGPKYFKFELNSKDTERLIRWLGLSEQPNLPERYLSSIDFLKMSSGWENFNWDLANIYSTVYCNIDGSETMYDLLFVDGRQVVYATLGYMHPQNLNHAENVSTCEPKRSIKDVGVD